MNFLRPGQPLDFNSPPARIVSLVPSITETLFDLGVGDRLVGVTDFCIFPPDISADVLRIGGTKNPAISRIRALDPDLVYVNLEENLRRHGEEIALFAPVMASEPKNVSDVCTLIEGLSNIHDQRERGLEWIAAVHEALPVEHRTFRFACAIWKNPWMWCGGDTYVSNLIATTGGENVIAGLSRYPRLSVGEIRSFHPDLIFLPDEPFVFSEDDSKELQSTIGCRIVGPFPGHLITWHGTRTVRGLHFLREVLG